MPDGFVVRDLFPTHSLHLIYGPSGAGRSTLLFQTIWDWSHGKEVLGYQSIPASYALISAVQTRSEMRAHFSLLGMDPGLIPHLSLLEAAIPEDRTIEGALRLARNIAPHLRVLFVDGLAGLCPGNINILREAAQYLSGIRQLCFKQDLTIIGTVLCGKSDEESAVRHRPIGSAAWSEYTGTKICIEPVNAQKLDDPDRMIHIIPRAGSPTSKRYTLDPETHRLTPTEELGASANALTEWLDQFQASEEISVALILQAGAQFGMSRATTYRWIKQCVELGVLVNAKRGYYIKPPAKVVPISQTGTP